MASSGTGRSPCDAQHPITAGMPRVWKHVKDELYHGQRGPAENVNILLSAFDDAKYQGTGKHEPVLWWVPYGKGKVVTNVMGHVGESSGPLACVGFQTVFLRSIEWLVTGKCPRPSPTTSPPRTSPAAAFLVACPRCRSWISLRSRPWTGSKCRKVIALNSSPQSPPSCILCSAPGMGTGTCMSRKCASYMP